MIMISWFSCGHHGGSVAERGRTTAPHSDPQAAGNKAPIACDSASMSIQGMLEIVPDVLVQGLQR